MLWFYTKDRLKSSLIYLLFLKIFEKGLDKLLLNVVVSEYINICDDRGKVLFLDSTERGCQVESPEFF